MNMNYPQPSEQLVIGRSYMHGCNGRRWKVRITALPSARIDVRKPAFAFSIWEGVLAGEQFGLEDESPVWGYQYQLEPIEPWDKKDGK